MPDPAPQPIDWMKTIVVPLLSAIAAMFAGLHYGGNTPAPTPQPAPFGQPAPNPKPDPLPTGIKITDSRGNPVNGSVDAGRQFSILASGSTTLYAVPDSDAEITTISKQQLVCTLHNGITLQVVVLNNGADPSILKILCNKGSQPPPDDKKVIPDDHKQDNQPTPIKQRLLQLSVIEDPLNRTAATVSILNNVAIWNKYIAKGHQFRTYAAMMDSGQIKATSTESKGIKATNAANAKSLKLPALVFSDLVTGEVLNAVALPTNDMLDSVISANGG